MQSIKSNALEPTRSELAGLSRWRQIGRLLPVYGLPILTVLLIIFFSLHPAADLSDLSELPLDPRRQGDHRDAVARRHDPDDGRPHRPECRLRHRHVAHPGDRPAGHVRRALAAGDPARALRRGAGRPLQRHPRRGGADRLLHRDARHRHHPLCDRALVHRRAPARRHALAGLHRDQHDDRSSAFRSRRST